MTVYLDTSNLIKLYLDEPGADDVQRLVARADVVVASVLAYAEARATFARRRRERLMTTAEAKVVIGQLDEDWPRFVLIPVDEAQALAAGRLADTHGLRGGDAVHLAAFESVVSRCVESEAHFSCADARLRRAAKSLE